MPAIVFIVFFCANLYVWSLAISQVQLLLVTAVLGVAFFSWLFWFVSREPDAAVARTDL